MNRLLTNTATTKRAPTLAGGKRGVPVAFLTDVKCTPVDPVEDEIMLRLYPVDTPHRLMQSFVPGEYDIQLADVFIVNGNEYPVKGVADWEWKSTSFKRLLLEDLRIG